MPAGAGVSVDFTFAHPQATKATSRNATLAPKCEKKLRFFAVRRKFINSYPPGMLVAASQKCVFIPLTRTQYVFRTAAGSSNRRAQGLTSHKNNWKAHSSKYWKEPSPQEPPVHNLRTKVRIRCPSVSPLGVAAGNTTGTAGFVIGAAGPTCELLPPGRSGAAAFTAIRSPSTLP